MPGRERPGLLITHTLTPHSPDEVSGEGLLVSFARHNPLPSDCVQRRLSQVCDTGEIVAAVSATERWTSGAVLKKANSPRVMSASHATTTGTFRVPAVRPPSELSAHLNRTVRHRLGHRNHALRSRTQKLRGRSGRPTIGFLPGVNRWQRHPVLEVGLRRVQTDLMSRSSPPSHSTVDRLLFHSIRPSRLQPPPGAGAGSGARVSFEEHR